MGFSRSYGVVSLTVIVFVSGFWVGSSGRIQFDDPGFTGEGPSPGPAMGSPPSRVQLFFRDRYVRHHHSISIFLLVK